MNVGESPKERLLINYPESPGQTHMCALNNSTFIQRGFVEYLQDRCCNPGKFQLCFAQIYRVLMEVLNINRDLQC